MLPVSIDGVIDNDSIHNSITIGITGVTQDEPVNGLGDGDSSPDAAILDEGPAGSVLLRAERGGSGDGRVYEISFTAEDGFESCIGSVRVVIPQRRVGSSIDSGQLFDSTQP